MSRRSMQLYMLEPDDDDRHLTRSVFSDKAYPVQLTFFSDSGELMRFLDNLEAAAFPDLVLINGNLRPEGIALEFLESFKAHDLYRGIPVVVVSNRLPADEILKYYAMGASSFIEKPFTNDRAMEKMEVFVRYWFDVVELPRISG
ncbi:MAG TPA: response regulator [Flavitalea sp.]|nr:response regulator [Flavitalea sp.]